MENQGRFDLLLAAMPGKVWDQITDMVENVPEAYPYVKLKALLLETHTLSNQEKMDVLLQIQAVGRPELNTDVGHHAGLMSLWHGTVHHVPVHVPAASAGHLTGGTGVWGHQKPSGMGTGQKAVGHSEAAVSRSSGQRGHV